MNVKRRKKASRMHGRKMGTHGRGARKKAKGQGHRGGRGLSGSGKRGDQKKTLITKKYGGNYFGKQGITSRGTKRDTRQRINVGEIQLNLEKFSKKDSKGVVELRDYKILGGGVVKDKLKIYAKQASNSAIEKVKKAGGEIILPEVKQKIEKEEIPQEDSE